MAHQTWTQPDRAVKAEVVQAFRVTWPSGWQTTVCCGPATLRALRAGAETYERIGAQRTGRCCHR